MKRPVELPRRLQGTEVRLQPQLHEESPLPTPQPPRPTDDVPPDAPRVPPESVVPLSPTGGRVRAGGRSGQSRVGAEWGHTLLTTTR